MHPFTLLLWACATTATPPPPVPPAPPPAPKLTVSEFGCDVDGGDGDGSVAVWYHHVSGTVENVADTEVTVRWHVEETGLTGEGTVTLHEGAFWLSERLHVPSLRRLREHDTLTVQVEVSWPTGEQQSAALTLTPTFC